jgi:hypothetical protein
MPGHQDLIERGRTSILDSMKLIERAETVMATSEERLRLSAHRTKASRLHRGEPIGRV